MLLPNIPREVFALYAGLSWWERAHVWLRWKLCPFPAIAAHVPAAGAIADIGCGRGMMANFLALTGPGRKVLGVDRQRQRIQAARATVGSRTNISFRNQDVRDLGGETFDAVIVSDMVHHLDYPDQEAFLGRCYDMVRPGGLLLLEDVGETPRWKYVSHYLIDRTLNKGRGQKFRKLREWKGILEKIGFAVETCPVHRGLPLPDHLFICRKPSA